MSVEIPSQCQTCPVVCGIKDRIDSDNVRMDKLIQTSVSNAPERFAEFMQEAGSHYGIDAGDLFETQEFASNIREISGVAVEALKDKIESSEAKLTELTTECAGPLGLRAVRDTTQYTVKICTSPALVGRTKNESAKVTRTELS